MCACVNSKFADIFSNAVLELLKFDVDIKIPRIAARQQHRANVDANDVETYFRITIMIPLLDDFIKQLESRFDNHKTTLTPLYILIPSVCWKNEYSNGEDSFKVYKKFIKWDSIRAEISGKLNGDNSQK